MPMSAQWADDISENIANKQKTEASDATGIVRKKKQPKRKPKKKQGRDPAHESMIQTDSQESMHGLYQFVQKVVEDR